nr:hypothetical protein [Tanacetum cinerariifolium]
HCEFIDDVNDTKTQGVIVECRESSWYNDVIANQVIQNPKNQIGNGNLVTTRAEGNAAGQNANQIRCYNCRGLGIANLSGTGNVVAARAEGTEIGNQARCYNCRGLGDLDEIEEVNANCILMANLQQASTSGTQYDRALVYDTDGSAKAKEKGCFLSSDTVINCSEGRGMNPTSSRRTDSAPVYDSDGSAEVHENCDDNEIFNMFTQEEQYTELLEPIPESHQVPQNDNNVIFEATSVEQGGETVE